MRTQTPKTSAMVLVLVLIGTTLLFVGIVLAVFVHFAAGTQVHMECGGKTRLYTPGTWNKEWCIRQRYQGICLDARSRIYPCPKTRWIGCYKQRDRAEQLCKQHGADP